MALFRSSIAAKLLAVVIVVELVLFASLWTLASRELEAALESSFRSQLVTLRAPLNAAVARRLSQGDIVSIREVISSSRSDLGLTYLTVRDERDQIVASAGWRQDEVLPLPSRSIEEGQDYHGFVLIEVDGRKIGTLNFGLSTQFLKTELDRLLKRMAWAAVGSIVLTALLLALVLYLGTRRLMMLTQASERMAQGDFDAPVARGGADEVGRLTESFISMRDAIRNQIVQLRQSDETVRRLNAGLESRVARRTAQLEAANHELKTANAELESFAYSISHDLRAPVRAVNSFSSLVVTRHAEALSAEGRALLGRVIANACRMETLIDDLLNFARLSRLPVCRQVVEDPRGIVESVLRELRESGVPEAEVQIGDLPLCHADPGLLAQVYSNLLSNAFKYGRTATRPRVEIGATGGVQGATYYVRDHGTGFDMAHAGSLFGVFRRLHGEEFEGNGVGLAIVKNIVDRHGGRIWAESAPGSGATFFFTLSRQEA